MGGVDHVKVLNYIAKKNNIRVNKCYYPAKVQKTAYFAECFCMREHQKQLMDTAPISWDKGPVYTVSHDNQDKSCVLPSCVTNLLDKVIKLLSKFSDDELIKLSHETFPWKLHKKTAEDRYSKPIDKEIMGIFANSYNFDMLIERFKNKNKNN